MRPKRVHSLYLIEIFCFPIYYNNTHSLKLTIHSSVVNALISTYRKKSI